MPQEEMNFFQRVISLPTLGIGVSTEYGAGHSKGALDPSELYERRPEFAAFLEVGVETAVGLDEDVLRWVDQGRATTYHFLDVNLDEREDFEPAWLEEVRAGASRIKPAWMCGDAGLWHFGPRDRGHMLLLPPILSEDSAQDMAEGIRRLRMETGFEVLPENPPGNFFLGDMHILEFFQRVCELADTGMCLDCAHLGMYQTIKGHEPLDFLDTFDWSRVVEMHVAGGTIRDHSGFLWVDDDHTTEVFEDTWQIFSYALERAANLKAVVFECERNSIEGVLGGFERILELTKSSALNTELREGVL